MKISAAARVNVGKVRKNNEDNLYFNGKVLDESIRELPFSDSLEADGNAFTFAVCDGMGGEQAGEEASLLGVNVFGKWYAEHEADGGFSAQTTDWDKKIGEYCRTASEKVYALSKQTGGRSGCTFVNITLSDDSLMFANVGDSRLYAYCDKRLIQLSEDHTLASLMQKSGALTAEQARVSPDRNKLTRYIGAAPDDSNMAPFTGQIISLRKGDRFLLCSDGLTDMLSDKDIADILAANSDDNTAADKLLEKALENGGRDNCTIILITVRDCSGSGKGSRAFAAVVANRPSFPNRWQWVAMLAIFMLLVLAGFCALDGGSFPL